MYRKCLDDHEEFLDFSVQQDIVIECLLKSNLFLMTSMKLQ